MPQATGDFSPGALATWQDADGTRWIAVPSVAAAAAAKFTAPTARSPAAPSSPSR